MFDLDRVETLATQFQNQGDYETAELLLSNILEIKQRDKGAAQMELISVLHKLATISQLQNKHSEALRYAKQAFKIVRDKLGPSGYDAAETLAWIKTLTHSAA